MNVRLRVLDLSRVFLIAAFTAGFVHSTAAAQTPDLDLLWNARMGNEAAAIQLLQKGADPNAVDNHGMTSLIFAARFGKKALAELLVAKGASVNAQNKLGLTALSFAKTGGYVDIAQLLIAHGAVLSDSDRVSIGEKDKQDANADYDNAYRTAAQAYADRKYAQAFSLLDKAGFTRPLDPKWVNTLHEATWIQGQELLVDMYTDGNGVPRDPAAAAQHRQNLVAYYARALTQHDLNHIDKSARDLRKLFGANLTPDTDDRLLSGLWLSRYPSAPSSTPDVVNLPPHVVKELDDVFAKGAAQNREAGLCFESEHFFADPFLRTHLPIHDNRVGTPGSLVDLEIGGADGIDRTFCNVKAGLHDVDIHTHPVGYPGIFSGGDLANYVVSSLRDPSPFRLNSIGIVRGEHDISMAFPVGPQSFGDEPERLASKMTLKTAIDARGADYANSKDELTLIRLMSSPELPPQLRQIYKELQAEAAKLSPYVRRHERAIAFSEMLPFLDAELGGHSTDIQTADLAQESYILNRYNYALYHGDVQGVLHRVEPHAYQPSARLTFLVSVLADCARFAAGEDVTTLAGRKAPDTADTDAEANLSHVPLSHSDRLATFFASVGGFPYETPTGRNLLGVGNASGEWGARQFEGEPSEFVNGEFQPWIVTVSAAQRNNRPVLAVWLTRYRPLSMKKAEPIEGAPAIYALISLQTQTVLAFGKGRWHDNAFDLVTAHYDDGTRWHERHEFHDSRPSFGVVGPG